MITFYRRKTLRRRFWSFCDDCQCWLDRHGKWFIGGFWLGVLSMCIVADIVWRL